MFNISITVCYLTVADLNQPKNCKCIKFTWCTGQKYTCKVLFLIRTVVPQDCVFGKHDAKSLIGFPNYIPTLSIFISSGKI